MYNRSYATDGIDGTDGTDETPFGESQHPIGAASEGRTVYDRSDDGLGVVLCHTPDHLDIYIISIFIVWS